jgi:hypothetical protein
MPILSNPRNYMGLHTNENFQAICHKLSCSTSGLSMLIMGSHTCFNGLKYRFHEQIKNIWGNCDNPGSQLGIYEERIQDIFVCCIGIEKSYDQRNNNDAQKEATQKDKQFLRNTSFSRRFHFLHGSNQLSRIREIIRLLIRLKQHT